MAWFRQMQPHYSAILWDVPTGHPRQKVWLLVLSTWYLGEPKLKSNCSAVCPKVSAVLKAWQKHGEMPFANEKPQTFRSAWLMVDWAELCWSTAVNLIVPVPLKHNFDHFEGQNCTHPNRQIQWLNHRNQMTRRHIYTNLNQGFQKLIDPKLDSVFHNTKRIPSAFPGIFSCN